MLEEASREFRRVAELRPSEGQRAVLSRSDRGSAGPLVGARPRSGRRSTGAGRGRLAAQPGGRARAAGRLDQAETVLAEAAGRSPDEPRVQPAGASRRWSGASRAVARSGCGRARELVSRTIRRPLWYWAAARAASGRSRRSRVRARHRAGRGGAPPRASGAAQQPRGAARGHRAMAEAERSCGGCCCGVKRRCRSRSRIWAICCYRRRPLRRGRAALHARRGCWLPIWATTSTSSSGNLAFRERDIARARAVLGAHPGAQSRAPAGPGQSRDAAGGAMIGSPTSD